MSITAVLIPTVMCWANNRLFCNSLKMAPRAETFSSFSNCQEFYLIKLLC